MRLKSIHLRNFRRHADSFIEFPPRGVIGIVAENEGGKSTVIEGVTWALYGSDGIRKSMKGLRWWRASARRPAEVDLVIEINGDTLRVNRTETSATLYLDGSSTPIAAGKDAVTQYLVQQIGMTYDEFCSTYLSAQKDIERIATLRPAERKSFFRRIMGIEVIDRAIEACRERKNALKAEHSGLAAGLGEREPLAAALSQAEAQVAACTEEVQQWVARCEEAEQKRDAVAVQLDDLRRVKQEFERAQASVNETAAKRAAADDEWRRVSASLAEAMAARTKLAEADVALRTLPALRQQLADVQAFAAADARIRALHGRVNTTTEALHRARLDLERATASDAAYDEAEMARVTTAYRDTERRLNDMTSERRSRHAAATAEHRAAGAERIRLEKRLSATQQRGPDGACPTCTRALGEHFDAVVAGVRDDLQRISATEEAAYARAVALTEKGDDEIMLEEELESLKRVGEALRGLQQAAAKASATLPLLRTNIEGYEATLRDLQEEIATTPVPAQPEPDAEQRLTDGIAALEKIEREAEPLRSRAALVEHLEQEAAAAMARQQRAEEAHAEALRWMESVPFSQSAFDEVSARHSALVTTAWEANEARVRADARMQAANDLCARARRDLAAYDEKAARLDAIAEDLRVHEASDRRLDAFRTYAAGLIRPEMEELVSGFIYALTDGKHESATITEDFEVILQEGGIDCEVISGGAQDIAALAQRVAVAYMSAQRHGRALSLLVLDEPTASLSEIRRANALNFIRQLGGTFEQVLLISHSEETKQAADHVIELVDDPDAGCCRVLAQSGPGTASPAALELAEVAA